jgi:hypothetical protein
MTRGIDSMTHFTSRRKEAMTGPREIFDTITTEQGFDIDELVMVLEALTDLERDSTACAMAMVGEPDATDMVSATHAALDCADIAVATQRVLSRGFSTDVAVTKAVLQAAIAAADRCAEECGHHAARHAHCRVHVASARQAAARCRAELERLAG